MGHNGQIRPLDLNNQSRVQALASIAAHREDLWSYIENFNLLELYKKTISLDLAQKQFKITQFFYENTDTIFREGLNAGELLLVESLRNASK